MEKKLKKPDLIRVKLAIFMWIAIALFSSHPAVLSDAFSIIEVGRFSNVKASDVLPINWEIFDFKKIKRHITYRLLEENAIITE